MKRNLDDLALFGGRPAFLYPLRVGRPNRVDRARLFDRLNWSLDNEWLTNGGPLTREFEDRIAELAGTRYCVATCNATVGLQLVARAARLTGEVVMPSLTFIATAHAIRWLGLEPVFCDIDPVTGCIDAESVAAVISDRTSAIMAVHVWGHPCSAADLEKLAADRGISLFFDSAHALGCTADGQPVGSFGNAEVFSFHATKIVNAFEGGAVVTNDSELAGQIRALHNFGIGLDPAHDAGGTNGKLSEASAAMGLTSLDALPEYIRHNQANYLLYRAELDNLPGVRIVEFPRDEHSNYQYVILVNDGEVTGITRDLLMTLLLAERVETKPYFSPACHEQEPYLSRRPVQLPHTERLAAQVIALPTGTSVGREDIRRACNIIRLATSKGAEITARWQAAQPSR